MNCSPLVILVGMHGFVDELIDTDVTLLVICRSYCPDADFSVKSTTEQQRSRFQKLKASNIVVVTKQKCLQLG